MLKLAAIGCLLIAVPIPSEGIGEIVAGIRQVAAVLGFRLGRRALRVVCPSYCGLHICCAAIFGPAAQLRFAERV
jgi:hypothetical protein